MSERTDDRPRRSDGSIQPEPEPTVQGAILSPVGVVPGAMVLTAGRPRPEPEDRWTLGPERRPQKDEASDVGPEPGYEAPPTAVERGPIHGRGR